LSQERTVLFLSSTTHIFIDSFSIAIAIVAAEIFGRQQRYMEVGIILASFTAATAIAEPLWGLISDLRQRRGFHISLGLFSSCLLFSLFSIHSLVSFDRLLFLSSVSFLTGIFAGSYHSVATTLLNETVKNERRGYYQGINNAGGSIGRMLTPLLLSFLITKVSFYAAFAPFLLLGIPISIISFFFYPASDFKVIQLKVIKKNLFYVDRFVVLLMIISFLRTSFFLTVVNFLPSFLVGFKNFDLMKSGYFMTIVLALGIIAQPVGGKISDFSNRSFLMAFLLIFSGFTFFLFLYLPLFLGVLSLSLSFFALLMTFPILFAIIGDEIPKENMAYLTGLVSGAGGFSAALFQLLSGAVSEVISPFSAFLFLSFFPLLSGFASLLIKRKKIRKANL